MKKKLEGELVSIAHRVLKLKNREETKQLQEEAKRLYEQLTILRFYEENFERVKDEISQEVFEAKMEQSKTLETIELEEKSVPQSEKLVLFNNVLNDDFKDLDFVRVEDIPKETAQITETLFEEVQELIFEEKEPEIEHIQENVEDEKGVEETEEVIEEQPKPITIAPAQPKTISVGLIGLNDRIAFKDQLFDGSEDDFIRVLSQLNTFDTFEEAKGFIEDFIKPDYNNWDGKEEYEARFLEIIEKKFV